MNRWWLAAIAPVLVVLALGPPAGAADKKSPAKKKPAAGAEKNASAEKGEAGRTPVAVEPATFPMEEVPAFGKEEVDGKTRFYYPFGTMAMCSTEPNKEVKYPELKSKRPLYGAVSFDASPRDAKSGKTFYFVLDESGEKKADEAEKKSEDADKKADEGKGKTKSRARPAPELKYDRLYIDCNADLDLTNDAVVKLAEKPPFEGLPAGAQSGCFEDVKLMLDYGPPTGKQPFTVVPLARSYFRDNVAVQVVPKTARKGKIKLGGQEYVARLSQTRTLTGRYDRPQVQIDLVPVDGKAGGMVTGSLAMMRSIDGQFVSFTASPLGDKLSIEPYRGETGVLEVVSGGRAITELGITGQLTSSKGVMLALGEGMPQGPGDMPRRYTLPVGDYTLPSFTARHGRLRFSGRMTANVSPPSGQSPSFPIEVRKDKPFEVKFSGKPEVRFMAPPQERTYKPGDNIYISAMLTEPWESIQITGLWDISEKEGKPAGNSLDPTIAIRNAAGEVVSTGKMPFG
jgi:hypothetical protein